MQQREQQSIGSINNRIRVDIANKPHYRRYQRSNAHMYSSAIVAQYRFPKRAEYAAWHANCVGVAGSPWSLAVSASVFGGRYAILVAKRSAGTGSCHTSIDTGCYGVVEQVHKVPANAVSVASANELEELYGDSIRHVALENKTSYKLCRALRGREPPICVTDKLASAWLKK